MKKIPQFWSIIAIIILVVIVVSAIISIERWSSSPDRFVASNQTHLYHDDKLGFTLSYPANLVFSAKATGTTTDAVKQLDFSTHGVTITVVPYVISADTAITEKSFAASVLFSNPKQKNNFKISRDGWDGFKSVQDFNKSNYALYRDISSSTVLVLRADVISPSNATFSIAETLFLKIVASIVFQ